MNDDDVTTPYMRTGSSPTTMQTLQQQQQQRKEQKYHHHPIIGSADIVQNGIDCDTGEFILNDQTSDEFLSDTARRKRTIFLVVRAFVTVTVIALILWALIDALTTKNIEEWLVTWISIVEDHMFIGMFILVAIYIIAGVLFVPQPLLSIGVGYAFGQAFPDMLYLSIPMSICSALIGATTGSLVCLLLGRYLFRDCAIRCAHRYRIFLALDRALAVNGFKVLVLMRLSPVPNHVLDYVSGITSIRILHYVAASIGIIPSTIAFCYAGATASSISEGEENLHKTDHTLSTIMLVLGLLFGISGIGLTSYYAKKELDQMIPPENDDEQHLSHNENTNQYNTPIDNNSKNSIHQLNHASSTYQQNYINKTQSEIV